MDETTYGLRVRVPVEYDQAVGLATAALKQEGFGVLTVIDVRQTLRQKLDVDFRKYVILGACNPPLAHRALRAETDAGLLLPCNVVVYEAGPRESIVAALAPMAMMGLVGENPDLAAVAREADARVRRALLSLEARHAGETVTLQSPLGQLERSLIDEFVRARGYDPARLSALPEGERDRLLRDASVHASSKLTEVESRSHYLDEMHSGSRRDDQS
jgi:uncharacterized protein (DUF302 family)